MDAISFVLGEPTKTLRVRKLSVCIDRSAPVPVDPFFRSS